MLRPGAHLFMAPGRPASPILLLLTLCIGACATASASRTATPHPFPVPHPHVGSGYTPHRIYDVAAAQFIDLEAFAARAAGADVVVFGERHGHRPTHRMQLALLETLTRRGGATLSLEMLERDVAPALTAYVQGTIDFHTFARRARPWPNHATDYHPLVEHARVHAWRVVAANVPRSIATDVAREGLGALEALPASASAYFADDIVCPDDAYRGRFLEEMTQPADAPAHGHAHARLDDAALQRYYEAQCLRDETMAESIAQALDAGTGAPVVHMTGGFHVDYGDGIPARLRRRLPEVTLITISSVPVPSLDEIDVDDHVDRADYLLFTLQAARPRADPAESGR
jgi:uncharacterized iron-regulated protein